MSLKVCLLLSLIFFSAVICQEEIPELQEEIPELQEAPPGDQEAPPNNQEAPPNNQEAPPNQDKRSGDTSWCGFVDTEESDGRSKRPVYSNKKWLMTDLTYKIFSYPTNTEHFNNEKVDEIIGNSFQRWSKAAPKLKFTKTDSDSATFKIEFFEGEHTDKYSFDGVGKVLGHAFFPRSGKIHFDNAEIFVKDRPIAKTGKLLEYIATHEIGHSLGLKHSQDSSAVMGKWYPGYKPEFKLQPDDIEGIKFLYG